MAFFDAQAYSQIFYKVEIHLAKTSHIIKFNTMRNIIVIANCVFT
jgi:hypothetical protein